MRLRSNELKSLSTALLLFGLTAVALAGFASAETLTISPPTKDNFYYVPGETITVTYSGMGASTHYDITIENSTGDIVWSEYNVSSSSGTLTRTITIGDSWDGYHVIYAYVNGSGFPMNSQYFYVELFWLSAEADHPVYLPGDRVTVYYYTQRLDNQQSLSSGQGRWRVTVQRDNGSGFVNEVLSNAVSDPRGNFNIDLPPTTRPGSYLVTFYYNDTSNAHSQDESFYIYVGSFNIGVSTDRTVYAPGDSVLVTVTANTQGSFQSEPTKGAEVTLKVEKYDTTAGTWNEDTSFGTRTGSTDVGGRVSFLVPLPAGIPDDTQLRARASASKGGTPQEATDQFTVRTATGLSIDLVLDKSIYKPGETIKARLVFVTLNTSLITGSMYQWEIADSNTGRVFVYSYEAGTSTGAEKDFVIPTDFTGEIYVYVEVYTPDDNSYSRTEYADVFAYSLLINPSRQVYNPRDVITVNVALVTDRVTSAAFYWTVTPNAGGEALAKNSIPAGGKTASFEFTIPAEPDDSYTISVAAEGGGLVARDTSGISRAKYTALQITIPDGSYKPGDTVKIHYTFVPVGGATPPPTTTISVYLGVYPYFLQGSGRSFDVDTSQSLSGDLMYTIPATAPSNADMTITATAGSYGSSSSTLYVRPSAGASPASAAGSTATWGLVIAVVAVALAGFALMRKGQSGSSGPGRFTETGGHGGFKVEDNEAPKPRDRIMDNTNVIGQPIKDEKRVHFAEGEPPKSL